MLEKQLTKQWIRWHGKPLIKPLSAPSVMSNKRQVIVLCQHCPSHYAAIYSATDT